MGAATWDVASWDGPNCNVGFWLAGPGSGCLNTAYGDFYTSSPALLDPASARFLPTGIGFGIAGDGTSSLTGVRASVGATALATTNEVGWFSLDDDARALHPLVRGGGVMAGLVLPTGNYGFYGRVTLDGVEQIFYSDMLEDGRNQFVIFDIGGGTRQRYVLGFEDLVARGKIGSDYDYNDMMMVLEYESVPDAGSTLLMMGVGLAGMFGAARRWRQK